MQSTTLILAVVVVFGCVLASAAEQTQQLQLEPMLDTDGAAEAASHARSKRTLFLKKKLIGAGLLGLGLGAFKGYKLGYHSSPEVRHVYLAPPPPPVYIEKPVFVEKPVYKHAHVEYEPAWSPPEPSPVYGPW